MSRYSKLRRVALLAACVVSTSVMVSLGVTATAGAFPLAYNEKACVPAADVLHASGSSFQLNLEETLKKLGREQRLHRSAERNDDPLHVHVEW